VTEFRKVPLKTGVTLNVALAGPADAPPVILLHGFPESHRTWRGLAPLLEDEFRLVMPDQRGFAGSDRPQEHRPAARGWAAVTQVVDHRLADIRGQRQPIQTVALAPYQQLTGAPVDVVEPQGIDTLALGRIGAHEVCARLPGNCTARPGARLELAADMACMHLIDPATGQVIR